MSLSLTHINAKDLMSRVHTMLVQAVQSGADILTLWGRHLSNQCKQHVLLSFQREKMLNDSLTKIETVSEEQQKTVENRKT